MQIKQVLINNFRCHRSLKIDFEKYHTLVGENGSGKTAILEAIKLATSPYLDASSIKDSDFCNQADDPIFIKVTFDKYFGVAIPDGFNKKKLVCNSVCLKIKRRAKATAGKLLTTGFIVEHWVNPVHYDNINIIEDNRLPTGLSKTELPDSVTREIKGDDEFRYLISRKTGSPMQVDKRLLAISTETIGFPRIFLFDKRRESQAKSGFNSLLSRIADDLDWRFRRQADTSNFMELWNQFYNGLVDEVSDQKSDRILRPTLGKITEFLGEGYSSLELSILNLKQPFSKSFLSLREGVNQITLDGLGTGVSMMIAYCLLEAISEQSKEEIIILIDEPEMHLHPQWQKKIFEHFLDSNYQTIVSTHSPLIVNLADWRTISRLSKDRKVFPSQETSKLKLLGTEVSKHLDDFNERRRHHTVFIEGDPEVFFARKVLLVEGPADKYGIPKIAKYLNYSFHDITIISCEGKTKIEFYIQICIAFGLQHFVIFDLDKNNAKYETEEKPRNEKILSLLGNNNFYHFENSLESCLGIGANAHQKGTRTLEAIDRLIIDQEEVPQELQAAAQSISNWSSGRVKEIDKALQKA